MSSALSPDQAAAHALLAELRTRISTQHLPYQYGVEEKALESLHKLFEHVRQAIKDNPGCSEFARMAAHMLNVELRPVTGKWDSHQNAGTLSARDRAVEFRTDLLQVQHNLRVFANELHVLAYGTQLEDTPSPTPLSSEQLDYWFTPLPYGIPIDATLNGGISVHDACRINSDENHAIALRRSKYPDRGVSAVGLAFSGGGIRSATFCLGVTQVLAARGLLNDVDLLSTVSGGGYTGSFLNAHLGGGNTFAELATPHGPDSAPIQALRRGAKFLASRGLWESWGMVTATLAGMILNWTVPLLVVVVFAITAVGFKASTWDDHLWHGITVACLILSIILGIFYFQRIRSHSPHAPCAGSIFGFVTLLSVFLVSGWVLNLGFEGIFTMTAREPFTPNYGRPWDDLTHTFSSWGAVLAGIGGIGIVSPTVLRFVPLVRDPYLRKLAVKTALVMASVTLPVLSIAVYYLLSALGLASYGGIPGWTLLLALIGLLVAIDSFVLNINLTGPHRLYRSGLARSFLQEGASAGKPLALENTNDSQSAPYHILNAAVNVPTSNNIKLRDRKCDFFTFSKYWTGSPVIGYHRTSDWSMNGRKVDLSTAMAISGAAVSSNMGLGSIPPLRALLAFLNVRLGYWIRRPGIPGFWGLSVWQHPGFLCLLREMTGLGMAEHHRWINLSDGGHIENLAIYELLRRRCKFIISVDAEADPDFTFQGLMTLVRHAQIDFGVRIEPDLADIRPSQGVNCSSSHFHLCPIKYPATSDAPCSTGFLLYIKLSVTGNESELIKRYRISHPDFPHQATLDQFFDEEQFEAYRQLGVHATEGLFATCLINGSEMPKSVGEWFRRLSVNLLQP